jgi:FHA domain-containing protein
VIDRLEQALARVIDGGIASVFRLSVQPADIGRRLEHALLKSRRTSVGHVIGANSFAVKLHPDDFSAFASWKIALERELETWLGDIAFRHGVNMLAPIQVDVAADQGVGRRTVQVEAVFTSESAAKARAQIPVGRLIPLSQRSDVIVLVDAETTVGRASSNDLVIGAAEISREHALLRREGSRLQVHDLGSRNGTWVNGTRITRHEARSGDEIAFGTLRFRLDLP